MAFGTNGGRGIRRSKNSFLGKKKLKKKFPLTKVMLREHAL
jgi:hypothetical protein